MVTVTTAADWDVLNEELMGFEDGVVREVWVDSGRWLTPEDTVVESGMPQVVVLIQVQTAPTRSAILRFDGVNAFSFHQNRDVHPASARDVKGGWEAEFLSCRVTATSCVAEALGDGRVGRGPFLLNDRNIERLQDRTASARARTGGEHPLIGYLFDQVPDDM